MKYSLYVTLIVLILSVTSHASLVGWILGRDSSPFNILSSEKQFDKLMNQPNNPKSIESIDSSDEDHSSVQARSEIPFELSLADEKFIADAQKYTDLNLSELDLCQHKVRRIFQDSYKLNSISLSANQTSFSL